MPGLLKHYWPTESHLSLDLRQLWEHNPEDDMAAEDWYQDAGGRGSQSQSRSPSPGRAAGDLSLNGVFAFKFQSGLVIQQTMATPRL